jgi:DNA helicase INO80
MPAVPAVANLHVELWALLHFIMPSLFDSHDEFNEWFSKDIENAAENKGSKLNERQLRRLHMILKPFMLRRVKRHVQNELSEKVLITPNSLRGRYSRSILCRLRSIITSTCHPANVRYTVHFWRMYLW